MDLAPALYTIRINGTSVHDAVRVPAMVPQPAWRAHRLTGLLDRSAL